MKRGSPEKRWKGMIIGGKTILFVCFCFVSMPLSAAPVYGQSESFTGKVVWIDQDSRKLAIDPFTSEAAGLRIFSLDKSATVVMGEEKRHFKDIHVGDMVSVTYHEEGKGGNVVDGLAITSPAPISDEES